MQPSNLFFGYECGDNANLVTCYAGKVGGQQGGGVIGRHDVNLQGLDAGAIDFKVLWPGAMEWVLSGKLPGIVAGPETGFSPTNLPNGANGATVRPLWLANGQIGLYVWDMNHTGLYGYGRVFTSTSNWQAGALHHVRLEVRLNTPGKADGTCTLIVDGSPVVMVTDFQARNDAAMKLSDCFWCVFYGGDEPYFAPTKTQHIIIVDVTGSAI